MVLWSVTFDLAPAVQRVDSVTSGKAANNSWSSDICPANLQKFKVLTGKSLVWSDTLTVHFC